MTPSRSDQFGHGKQICCTSPIKVTNGNGVPFADAATSSLFVILVFLGNPVAAYKGVSSLMVTDALQ